MNYIVDNDTKVVVTGFGETSYPNIPTFQEITTLKNSMFLIEQYLKEQTKYPKTSYLFCVNLLDNAEYVYSFIDGKISVSEKFGFLKFLNKE